MTGLERLAVIGRTYRHLARYQQIIRILFTYGFGDLVDTLHVRRYLETVLRFVSRKDKHEQLERLTRAERVRLALEQLGPTFIKLGQLLSTRADLLSPEYLTELAKLQDRVREFSFDEVRRIIREELGAPPEELFKSFEQKPVGSASIAQGYRAELKDGTEVFVKVQRPGIRDKIRVDLEIMAHLASVLEHQSDEIRLLNPTRLIEEFARGLERETSFMKEAANIEQFSRQFEGNKRIHVPKVYRDYTTSRVLTMEFVRGVPCRDLARLQESCSNLPALAENIADLVLEQIFTYGYFHADPHPGNLYVLEKGVFCYVDFGMMGRITRRERQTFSELLLAINSRREKQVVSLMLGLTHHDEEPDRETLERDVAEFIDEYFYLSLAEVDLMRAISQLYSICYRHGLSLKPHVFTLLKALGTMEEFARQLNPQFQLTEHLAPFVHRLYLSRFNPFGLAQDALESSSQLLHFIQDLPEQLGSILQQIREGTIKAELEHRGLNNMIASHEHISNRIASAIVLAALIVGSSLMTLSNVPPKWHEIPILGLSGFVFAGVLGVRLLWDIHRSSK